MTTLLNLFNNNIINIEISKDLSAADIINLRQTCKSFNALMFEINQLKLKLNNHKNVVLFNNNILKICEKLHSLILDNLGWYMFFNFENIYNLKLKKITLHNNYSMCCDHFIENIKNLKHLEYLCISKTYIGSNIIDLKKLKKLNEFILIDLTIDDKLIIEFDRVKIIRIIKCYINEIIIDSNVMSDIITLELTNNNLECISENLVNLINLTNLDLQNNNLHNIPDNFVNLKNLIILNLSKNKIEKIPKNIENFKNLKILDISSNCIKKIPENIGNLQNLTTLNISKNFITAIPDSIGNLKNLTILDLSNNCIKIIPENFKNLKNLTKLNLSLNKIKIIENLVDLINLVELDLSSNEIQNIPKNFKNLINLTKLHLQQNNILILSENFRLLKNLTMLNILQNPKI